MEFAYNQNVHLTIDYLSFKIIYGFNSLTLLDLILLPKNDQYASKANNGHKHIIFLTRGLSLSAYTLILLDLILLPIEERPSVNNSKKT
jgi:hypothetical protein